MPTYYHIRMKGHLDDHWSAWFDNMTINNQANGETVLHGPLVDQAALHGVLIRIRDLSLPLLAISAVETGDRSVQTLVTAPLATCEIAAGDLDAARTRIDVELAWQAKMGSDAAAGAPLRAARK